MQPTVSGQYFLEKALTVLQNSIPPDYRRAA